jgi:hypothetical protein
MCSCVTKYMCFITAQLSQSWRVHERLYVPSLIKRNWAYKLSARLQHHIEHQTYQLGNLLRCPKIGKFNAPFVVNKNVCALKQKPQNHQDKEHDQTINDTEVISSVQASEFCTLMSLCIIAFLCRYSSPCKICLVYFLMTWSTYAADQFRFCCNIAENRRDWWLVTYRLREWTELSEKRLNGPSRNKLQQDVQRVFLTDGAKVPLLGRQKVGQTSSV